MESFQTSEQLDLLSQKKIYYSISEVCRLTDLEPHVLRYWENEFTQLKPKKNRAGNRAYKEKDIEIIRYIKKLLYEEKFTIPGARKKLMGTKVNECIEKDAAETVSPQNPKSIQEIKSELKGILDLLTSSGPA